MTRLEFYNLQLNSKRKIINRVNEILINNESKSIDILTSAKSIEEIGMKHLSRYYPHVVENLYNAISVRIGSETTASTVLNLSKVLTTALTEPYAEIRRDDENFDLSLRVTIGRRRFEDIGHLLLSQKIHLTGI